MCVMGIVRRLICSGLVQKPEMMKSENVPPRQFHPGQQRCRIRPVFVVVENKSGVAIDIVLQPANQNIESGFSG